MALLLSHWHCILPIGILLIFLLVSSISKKSKNKSDDSHTNVSVSDKSLKILDKKFAAGEITKAEYLRKNDLLRQ